MPKVDIVIANFEKDIDTSFDVWYTRATKFEIKGLPEKFLQVMDGKFRKSGYDTVEQAQEALEEATKIYREKIKSERKVILFRIAASENMTREPGTEIIAGQRMWGKRKAKMGNRIHSFDNPSILKGEVLGFHFLIALETNDGDKEYTIIQEAGLKQHYSRYADYDVIDWTEEREMFFQRISAGMHTLLHKLAYFFSEDEQVLLQRIHQASESTLSLLNF